MIIKRVASDRKPERKIKINESERTGREERPKPDENGKYGKQYVRKKLRNLASCQCIRVAEGDKQI